MFDLEKNVYDNAITSDSWGAAKLQLDIAKLYARLGNISEAVEHLKIGATAAKAFDKRPEEQFLSSILLGDMTDKKIDFETSDTRTLCEIMHDKWLSFPEFDQLRNADEFKEIINILC